MEDFINDDDLDEVKKEGKGLINSIKKLLRNSIGLIFKWLMNKIK